MASPCKEDSVPPSLSSRDRHVQRLKRYLQSSNPQRVYKVLVEIRVNYATGNREKAKMILESDLIKNLLTVLKENDAKLMNITLSILGNLLLHREARNQFKLYDGMKIISPIFKCVENESILGRAARVLANAWMDGMGFTFPDSGLLSGLTSVLGKSTLPPTVVSIFRVIRIFCQRSSKVSSAFLKVSYVEQSIKFLSSPSDDVVIAVLKSLTVVSYHEAEKLGTQLVESNLSLLIRLCNHENVSIWEPALETIVNLCKSQSLRPFLGSEGAILLFVSKLTSLGLQLKRPTYEACLIALCTFSAEAVNRVRLRELGGLALFLDVLSCTNGESTKKSLQHVVRSLHNFCYDTQSMKLLQAKGMTQAFMGLIERYVNVYKVKHFCNFETTSSPGSALQTDADDLVSCKACREFARSQRGGCSQINSSSRNLVPDQNQEFEHDSMEEEYSEVEFGPPLELGEESDEEDHANPSSASSNVEPTTRINEDLDDPCESSSNDKHFRISSPSYQQVIFEQEEFDKIRSIEQWVSRNIQMESTISAEKFFFNRSGIERVVIEQGTFNYKMSVIPTYVPPCYRDREKSEDYLFIDGIFAILLHIQASNWESNEAYSFRTTKAIVSYIKSTRHPSKAARSFLLHIAKSMNFLIPSIRNYQFSWIINELSTRCTNSSAKCARCNFNESLKNELFVEYSRTAETGFGIGILNYNLVCGNLNEMHSAAVATPLIIRSKQALWDTLLSHNGFRVLLEILNNPPNDEIFANAVLGIQELAKTLKFESPALSLPRLGSDWGQKKECKYARSELTNDAAFVMDDGSKVSCNKETLSASTSYFSAMFSGNFKESNLTEVPMKHRSNQAMNGLIHLVYGCECCSTLSGMGAVELVELLHMTDELLLEESEKLVAAMVLQKCNIPSSALLVYSTVKKDKTRLLGVEDGLQQGFFNHILGGYMRLTSRVDVFKEIVSSSFGQPFIQDLESCIKVRLANAPIGSNPKNS